MESNQHTFEEFTIVRTEVEERLGRKMTEGEWNEFIIELYDRLDFEGTIEDLIDEMTEAMDYDRDYNSEDYELGGEGEGE